ncbi:Hypothetical_protein [Hexamita inflata]|uniref:Hypothetical_protein n=1 Tax=Hexamita inflata TaxID=28002 RepID=A0AA86QNR6_9EUKA|nr:Hypothetical protein HINF_LOCUS50706 [Hexamita inflata]
MLFAQLFCKQLISARYSTCQQQISINNNIYTFCHKYQNINNRRINQHLILHQNTNYLFFYSQNVKNSTVNVKVPETLSFSLFGFVTAPELLNAQITVRIQSKVFQAALICDQCDLKSSDSIFIFTASGERICGLVLKLNKEIELNNIDLQFRINGKEQSGIMFQILKQANISICSTNLTGCFKCQEYDKYNCTKLLYMHKQCQQLRKHKRSQLLESGWKYQNRMSIYLQDQTFHLCLSHLQLGQLIDNQLSCYDNFDLVDDSCQCKQGFILNGSICLNISKQMHVIILKRITLLIMVSLHQINNYLTKHNLLAIKLTQYINQMIIISYLTTH